MRLLIATGAVTSEDSRDGARIVVLALARALAAHGATVSVLGRAAPSDDQARSAPTVRRREDREVTVYDSSAVAEMLPSLVAALECDRLLLLGAPGGLLARATRDCGVARHLWVTSGVAELGAAPPDADLSVLAAGDAVAASVEAWIGRRPPCVPLPVPPSDRSHAPGRHVLFLDPRPSAGVEMLFRVAEANPAIPFVVLETDPLEDDWRAHCFARARRCGNLDWRASDQDSGVLIGAARLLLLPSLQVDAPGWPIGLAQAAGVPALVADQPGLVDALGAGGRVVSALAPTAEWLDGIAALWADGPARVAALEMIAHRTVSLAPERIAASLIGRLAGGPGAA